MLYLGFESAMLITLSLFIIVNIQEPEIHNEEILPLFVVCSIVVLGYAAYVDDQDKKTPRATKIVNDAEHSLHMIQNNPNYTKHTHLSSYKNDQ